jgi:hypothetical protein
MPDNMDSEYATIIAHAHRVWEGPHRVLHGKGLSVIQIGWWLEPEKRFQPHWEPLHVTGSATPVYVQDDDDD